MRLFNSSPSRPVPWIMGLVGACLLSPHIAVSQPATIGAGAAYHTTESSAVDESGGSDKGYTVGDSILARVADNGDLKSEGPVRMARFAYVTGNVTWRDGPTGNWSQATVNLPLRQAAEILVLKGGRADLQFDDGSELRLGNGALVSLKTLYSDSKGEFTQIDLKEGLATLHSRHADSVYQIDTPIVSLKSAAPTQVRIGIAGGSEIAVQMGSATIEGPQGKTVIKEGNYVYLPSSTAAYQVKTSPAPDDWDKWNGDRNLVLAGGPETAKHVPANIALVAGDLESYGAWHQDQKNGWVWSPKGQSADWRPYKDGRWVSEEPFGWTWVSNEPWGWAPYHYGTWFQGSDGWNWCPGPYSQYWSPGVVSFTDYGDDIGWAPLSPWEVTYPAYCGLGLWGIGWGLNFSIGWCGCYFPFGGGFCEGRSWGNGFCNGYGFGNHGGFGDRFGGHEGFANRGGFGPGARNGGGGFVPANSRAGTTMVSRSGFGGTGVYRAAGNGSSMFGGGHTVGLAGSGTMISGPHSASPTAESRTSTRSFTSSRPSQAAAGRSTYQGSLPANVSRSVSSAGANIGGFASRANLSASEAANSARTSLGYTGRSASSGSSIYGRSAFGSGGVGRAYGGAAYHSGGSGYHSGYGSGYSGARSYSGGAGGGFSGGRAYSGGRSYGGGYSGSGGRSYGGSGSTGGTRGGGFSGGGARGGGGGHR